MAEEGEHWTTGFPREHWRRIWRNNPLARLNKEVKRRTVGMVPNERLVSAILTQQHDEWQVARRSFSGVADQRHAPSC